MLSVLSFRLHLHPSHQDESVQSNAYFLEQTVRSLVKLALTQELLVQQDFSPTCRDVALIKTERAGFLDSIL